MRYSFLAISFITIFLLSGCTLSPQPKSHNTTPDNQTQQNSPASTNNQDNATATSSPPTSVPTQKTLTPTTNTAPKTHQECVTQFCSGLNGTALKKCGEQNCMVNGIPIYPWQ